jgi:ketosteroid isomerase-like protein
VPSNSVWSVALLIAFAGCAGRNPDPEITDAGAASAEEASVRKTLADWLGALERNDLKALEEIIAPDYSITAEGRVMNRAEDLEVIRTGRVRFQSAATDSVRVRIFGGAAVVTGIGRFTVLLDGKPLGIRERFTDVYVRRGGRWQPVASHTTPLRG